MANKHKWHDVIVAMANGLDVQYEHNGGWHKLTDKGVNPFAYPQWEWRIKPKTIMIGDMEVPEPMRVAPRKGEMYYLASTLDLNYCARFVWDGDEHDLAYFRNGIVHLSEYAALIHSKALIKISGGKVET